MCHTASAYYVGKDASFAFGSVVPFAFNARQMHAWYHFGGGKPLLDEFFEQLGAGGERLGLHPRQDRREFVTQRQ